MLVWGWQRAVLLVAAGALSALAMPPFGFFPILFLTLPILFWCLEASTISGGLFTRLFGNAFWAGWMFGFGYFLAGLYWIGSAMLVEADAFAWALPLAIIGLPAFLATFWGLAASITRMLWPGGVLNLISFVAIFSLTEWVRGHVLTGFPWNSIGYALTSEIHFAQTASLIGIYGLGFIILFCATAPALIWLDRQDTRSDSRGPIIWPTILGLLVLAGSFGFGVARLSNTPVFLRDDMHIRIVQPNIPQKEKWLPENRQAVFDKLITLSDRKTTPDSNGMAEVTHLIWPESTIPFILAEDPAALSSIATLLPLGSTLLVGAARANYADAGAADYGDVYNAILALNDRGEIIQSYDKKHLTPFGEYLPLQSFLDAIGFESLTRKKGGFTKGTAQRRFKIPNTPAFLPLICYEVIFSGEIRNTAQNRLVSLFAGFVQLADDTGGAGDKNDIEWILNLTNDSWFDGTIGLAQHAHHARMRAIEEGLPLVRVANTGVSFIADPLGRLTFRSDEGVAVVFDGQIHHALPQPFYARIADWPFLILALLCIIVSMIGLIVQRRTYK